MFIKLQKLLKYLNTKGKHRVAGATVPSLGDATSGPLNARKGKY